MNRHKGLLLIALIYIFALVIAIPIVIYAPIESLIARVIVADIAATVWVFFMSTVFKNSSIYDPYWSIAPMVLIIPFISEFDIKTVFIVSVIYIWGVRLTLNWVYTFKDLLHQDWRYTYFKEKSGPYWPLVNFFGIHLMPTIVVVCAMIPAFLALEATSNPNIFLYVGAFLALSAVFIQFVSDYQMHQFRKQHTQTIIQQGLWRYSRHPNYFGEILFWFALFIMMMSVTSQPMAMFGAVINFVMFITVSIPLMEKRQLTKHEDYEEYQQSTSALFLWLPNNHQHQEKKA